MFEFLPGLPVTNDQLTLASANGHQTVHSLDTSLHGLPHRDTGDDTWGLQTHTPTDFGTQGTLRKTAMYFKEKPTYQIIYHCVD